MPKSKQSTKSTSNLKIVRSNVRPEQENRDVRTFKTLEVYQDALALSAELRKLETLKFRSPPLRLVIEQLIWRLPSGIACAYGARYHDRAHACDLLFDVTQGCSELMVVMDQLGALLTKTQKNPIKQTLEINERALRLRGRLLNLLRLWDQDGKAGRPSRPLAAPSRATWERDEAA